MIAPSRPRRSALYLPASNDRAVEKSRSLDVDVVILDIEDSVGPLEKDTARTGAVAALRENAHPPFMELVVRVNALDEDRGRADLAAVAPHKPAAVLVPKILDGQTARAAGEAIAQSCGPQTQFWAMMEMPSAILDALAIARLSREGPLSAFVVGINDLAKQMRAPLGADRSAFHASLSTIVLAARAEGLVVLDGVYNDISDREGFARECAEGHAFGFDGKTLIHPTQIDAAHRCFSPSAADIEWAKKIVAAFEAPENQDIGVLSIDGRMVERLHLEEAERIVAFSEMIERETRS